MSIAGFPISSLPISGLPERIGVSAFLICSSKVTVEASLSRRSYKGSGTLSVVGQSKTRLFAYYSHDFDWNVRVYYSITYDFSWDIGQLPFKVYQVEGRCVTNNGSCNGLPINTNDSENCTRRYIQTIFARNLSEVCGFLRNTSWKWPIQSIKRFSTPAASLINDGTNIPPECNELTEVEYCQIPECFEFCLQTDAITSMGMSTFVIESIKKYTSIGGIKLNGGYDSVRRYSSNGSIQIQGQFEVESRLASYLYEASGNIAVVGNSNIVSSRWTTVGTGAIDLAGQSLIKSSKWISKSNGHVNVGNGVLTKTIVRAKYTSLGSSNNYPTYAGISISGFAFYPIKTLTRGVIKVSGSNLAYRKKSNHLGNGSIKILGNSNYISPSWHYTPTGSITMSGNILYKYLSLSYAVDNSYPITLDGECTTRDSSLGNYWYNSTGQILSISGESNTNIRRINYKTQLQAFSINGQAQINSTYKPTQSVDIGMNAFVQDLEVTYSLDGTTAPNIVIPIQTVNTTCGNCNLVSTKLNFKQNLKYGTVFREFATRNALKMPESFNLFYNKKTDSWQSILHYSGTSADNNNHLESWRFNIEWACVSQYAQDSYSSSVWKFSMYISRKNTYTGLDFDTRLLILFPSEAICITADRDGLDFEFKFDAKRQSVSTKQNLLVDVINLYDNIGFFKGSYWANNKLNIRITEDFVVDNLNKNDITFIIPERQPQFSI